MRDRASLSVKLLAPATGDAVLFVPDELIALFPGPVAAGEVCACATAIPDARRSIVAKADALGILIAPLKVGAQQFTNSCEVPLCGAANT